MPSEPSSLDYLSAYLITKNPKYGQICGSIIGLKFEIYIAFKVVKSQKLAERSGHWVKTLDHTSQKASNALGWGRHSKAATFPEPGPGFFLSSILISF